MSIFNRTLIIDKNFIRFVNNEQFPPPRVNFSQENEETEASEIISLFETQVLSRHIDIKSRSLKDEGSCYYTIGSSGHEGNAVFGKIFPYTDLAFLHYRSSAFFIERSKQISGMTPIYDLGLSFVASSDDPISGGRHKVIGSKALNIPPQTSTIASHLPKAVGAAFSIDRAKNLNIKETQLKENSIILCSFGDASVNHATALTAINTAAWINDRGGHVPIIFICEDNEVGISVSTNKNWIENSLSKRPGINYIKTDGLDLIDLLSQTRKAEKICRINRTPIFLHMKTVRLLGHAGSDIEFGYRSLIDIEKTEFNDPLLHSARILIEKKIISKEEIINLYEHMRNRVNHVFNSVISRPKLNSVEDLISSIIPNEHKKVLPDFPKPQVRENYFGKEYNRIKKHQHMAKLLNYGLLDILLRYKNTVVFGEDVAEKGGVYHITADLHKKFGVRRVFNSPLDETAIIGFGLGLGHNSFLPIPEIQFLAYFHNAEDQIRGEAATLPFFSTGQYTNPMVLRIPGLAYQKGFGGHFHNDNSLAIFRDIPGIILAVPSNGKDAVRMFRTAVREAYQNGRVVIFIEPIALYNTKDLYEPGDNKWAFRYPEIFDEASVGDFSKYGNGKALTIISYGNGLYLSIQAKKEIEKKINKKIQVIDLCWLSDVNIKKIIKSIGICKKVLIVDECRRTGCHGEGILAQLSSIISPEIKLKLHAAEDSFIPLGKAAKITLPSKNSIIKQAINLINE